MYFSGNLLLCPLEGACSLIPQGAAQCQVLELTNAGGLERQSRLQSG